MQLLAQSQGSAGQMDAYVLSKPLGITGNITIQVVSSLATQSSLEVLAVAGLDPTQAYSLNLWSGSSNNTADLNWQANALNIGTSYVVGADLLNTIASSVPSWGFADAVPSTTVYNAITYTSQIGLNAGNPLYLGVPTNFASAGADLHIDIAIPLQHINIVHSVQTVISETTYVPSQTIVNEPVGFSVGNNKSYIPAQFRTNIVYVWANTAPYPITLNEINLPLITSGTSGTSGNGNQSLLIMGIYEGQSANSPFNLLTAYTQQLNPFQPYVNITWSPNQVIAANSFYAIGISDSNVSLKVPSPNGIGICKCLNPVSPAVFYGVNPSNFTGGYFTANFFNSNITGNQPMSVLPQFFNSQDITSFTSFVPALIITQTNDYIQVTTSTSTSTIVQGNDQRAINNFFDRTVAIMGLFIVIVPLMFLSIKIKSPMIMMVFLIMLLGFAYVIGIVNFWNIALIFMVWLLVVTKSG
jgi:hypothetical protein